MKRKILEMSTGYFRILEDPATNMPIWSAENLLVLFDKINEIIQAINEKGDL